ncbi:MAG TPA: hypothetical protein VM425_15350 [Myxococcota bacterium]|nr:hypothetical protein [Myxococcota bacterium]
MFQMFQKVIITASIISTLSCVSAWAQEATPEPADASAAQDGARFRWGISLGGGYEKVSSFAGPMGGLDCRLGVQINDMWAVYAQPHLSVGSLSTGTGGLGLSGLTGTFGAAALGEVTLIDRFFAAAGVGYGVLNNPSGFMLQARLGGYPLMGRGEDGARRKGLMLGVDFRTIFVEGYTAILVFGTIGYEAF